MSVGLLVLRIVAGTLSAGHGAQKLFGWFGGHGLRKTGEFFSSLGFRPGLPFAALAGFAELAGGLLLAVGFLEPVAALLLIGVMTTAIAVVHWSRVLWNTNGGIEFPLVMGAVSFATAAIGPGSLSLDDAFGLAWQGVWWALGAAGLGIAGGLGSWAIGRFQPARRRDLSAAA